MISCVVALPPDFVWLVLMQHEPHLQCLFGHVWVPAIVQVKWGESTGGVAGIVNSEVERNEAFA